MKYIPAKTTVAEWLQRLNYYRRQDDIDMMSQMIVQLEFYGYQVERVNGSYRLK